MQDWTEGQRSLLAEETSELTKSNILNQANISVLAQANANPQMALKLLS